MTARLEGKTCFVTAAGQGIGRAIAEMFAAEGALVWATDRDPEKLAGLGPVTRALDVTDRAAIQDLIEESGPLDVLVNAAGIVHMGSVLDCSDAEWANAFEINVTSMHHAIKAALPGMLSRGRGSIINIASGASSVRGLPNRHAYGASKAAVIGLTKAVAADFIRQGIRANAISPGTIDSPSLAQRIADQAARQKRAAEEVRAEYVARQPIGRLGLPEEVAYLAVYLASDESKFTTGAVHMVDGGFAL